MSCSRRSGSVSPMVRLRPKGLSVLLRIHSRSARSASGVRALRVGMVPRIPASAAATIISLLEMMNMGAETMG